MRRKSETNVSCGSGDNSRHLALRWFRVADAAQRLVYVPTHLQKADGLTKDTVARTLLLQTLRPSLEDDADWDADAGASVFLVRGMPEI